MKNLLLSTAIGDISGEPYEFYESTKDYDAVDLLFPGNDYTDDTPSAHLLAPRLYFTILTWHITCGKDAVKI